MQGLLVASADHSGVCRAMRMKRPAVVQPAATLQALVAPPMAPQAFLIITRYFPHRFCGVAYHAYLMTATVAVNVSDSRP